MAVHRRCRIRGAAKAALLSAEALDASWNAAKAASRQENSTSTDQQAPTTGRPAVSKIFVLSGFHLAVLMTLTDNICQDARCRTRSNAAEAIGG